MWDTNIFGCVCTGRIHSQNSKATALFANTLCKSSERERKAVDRCRYTAQKKQQQARSQRAQNFEPEERVNAEPNATRQQLYILAPKGHKTPHALYTGLAHETCTNVNLDRAFEAFPGRIQQLRGVSDLRQILDVHSESVELRVR